MSQGLCPLRKSSNISSTLFWCSAVTHLTGRSSEALSLPELSSLLSDTDSSSSSRSVLYGCWEACEWLIVHIWNELPTGLDDSTDWGCTSGNAGDVVALHAELIHLLIDFCPPSARVFQSHFCLLNVHAEFLE